MTLSKAQGCLMGQLVGDSLGSLVEFESPEIIGRKYPAGVREMADGGCWNTLAGQPTDDSEMAIVLARTLVERGTYDSRAALGAYQAWLDTNPFDCGATVAAGLRGRPNTESQANGALMRISPVGILGAAHPLTTAAEWAKQDAMLTHPNPICIQVNMLFAMALARATSSDLAPEQLYTEIKQWADAMESDPLICVTIAKAAHAPPADFLSQQGWVLIAFHNALWQLFHARCFEDGVVDTIMRGGDTDTNAAICGALLGSVFGLESIPRRWVTAVVNCRPEKGAPEVHRPRPAHLWPVDALSLARQLSERKADTPPEIIQKD
jgi:ADP-ribosylglycohydrolase